MTAAPARRPGRSSASWRLSDRLGLGLAWLLGLLFCAIAAAIVIYFLVEGIRYLRPNLLVTNPAAAASSESQTGGFLDPLLGTVIVGAMAMAIAVPVGVGIAVWLSEFGRPTGLARVAESAVEMLAGEPSVVLALFGTILFTAPALGFLSQTTHGIVLGQSFFAAAALLSLVGLPMVVASTREGLQAIPSHVREASYAVGKTKIATTRRVLLPAARPSVITGTMLGLGRVISDTAIVLLLLGGTLTFSTANSTPVLGLLRGTGDTLTGYIYYNAPTGDGNQPSKAYAAAFVLMLMVLALNLGVDFVDRSLAAGGAMELRKPPPVRRLTGNEAYAPRVPVAPPPPGTVPQAAGHERQRAPTRVRGAGAADGAGQRDRDRPNAGRELSVTYGSQPAVKSVSLPIRQGEVLALIGPSGCGKTTLLRSLNRLTELTRGASASGRITLDGVDIADAGADRTPPPGDDGLPAAQPVPDERVRQRRLRAA